MYHSFLFSALRSLTVTLVFDNCFMVAVGTSIPEVATSVIAALKKETDISVGNILGSNIMNILSVLGITSIISPTMDEMPSTRLVSTRSILSDHARASATFLTACQARKTAGADIEVGAGGASSRSRRAQRTGTRRRRRAGRRHSLRRDAAETELAQSHGNAVVSSRRRSLVPALDRPGGDTARVLVDGTGVRPAGMPRPTNRVLPCPNDIFGPRFGTLIGCR